MADRRWERGPPRGRRRYYLIRRELIIDRTRTLAHDLAHGIGKGRPIEPREGSKVLTNRTGQGSNSANLRHYHERVILMALRRLGQASKADLARHTQRRTHLQCRAVDAARVDVDRASLQLQRRGARPAPRPRGWRAT